METSLPVFRPMGIGDILDRAISIYRENFLTMIGIVALINIPLLAIQALLLFLGIGSSPSGPVAQNLLANPALLVLFAGGSLLAGLLALVGTSFQTGALAVVVSEAYLGRRATLGQAYGRALRRGLSLLGVTLIAGLVYGALVLIALLPVLALAFVPALTRQSSSAAGLLALVLIPIFCLALIVGLLLLSLLGTLWSLTSPVIVLEDRGALAALGRSWRLVRSSVLRVFFTLLLLLLLVAVLTTAPASALQFVLVATIVNPLGITVLNSLIQGLLGLLVTPIYLAVITLLYYDLRIRKEGFDLELLAARAAPSLVGPSEQFRPPAIPA